MIPSAILDLQWMIGNVIMGSVAMLVRDWTHLNMAMSIPLLVSFPLVWMFTPESPSWLVSKGKLKEAAYPYLGTGQLKDRYVSFFLTLCFFI